MSATDVAACAGTPSPNALRVRRAFLRGLGSLTLVALLAVLPLVVLIRGGLFLDRVLAWNAWLSIGLAGGAAAALVSLYAFGLCRWLTGRRRYVLISTRIVGPASVVACFFALFHLATANAKDAAVHDAYRALHPMLRLAVASLCLFDERLVLTDIQRTPDGYRRMSLPIASRSLHYVQPDGFVHAVDLRTRGHGAPRNLLTQAWFLALGFETLRHTGSADHLHVALPPVREG